ncbi:MAG: S1 RNA-binding domain-containing protein [Vicinamibacteria bacterium]|nr:S1 RNA-binding domain-containing protein [Vicinamibacteria bacterium]
MSENEVGAEAEGRAEFARLLEASYATNQMKRLSNGQAVEGTIVAIGAEAALVDVGAKGEATIATSELRNHDGVLEAKVGDRIHATVVSTSGGIQLSRSLQRGAASAQRLEDAFRAGLPVEGKVEKSVKAGYEVSVAGQRAFCPQSQIDDVREADPLVHVGRVYTFKIVEFQDGGQKFVVSRRRLLEEEKQAIAAEVRQKIVAGAVLTGRVVSVRDFGAFVDLGGGVQGLLHASEMSWSRGSDPAKVVKPGEEITVKVIRVEDGKIALGLKQLTEDPWSTVGANYKVGQVLTGRVTRISEFGAFVELEAGVEALAHVSTFAPTGKPGGWSKSVTPGQTGAFEILSIEPDKKRIGVALIDEGSSRAAGARPSRSAIAPGARLTGKVERHDKFGVFVFLAPGVTGLLPAEETGLARGTDLVKALPLGSDIEVMVLEADAARRRIRLSVKAIAAAAEAAEVSDYAARTVAAQSQSFGSLADKLRGALEPRKK